MPNTYEAEGKNKTTVLSANLDLMYRRVTGALDDLLDEINHSSREDEGEEIVDLTSDGNLGRVLDMAPMQINSFLDNTLQKIDEIRNLIIHCES